MVISSPQNETNDTSSNHQTENVIDSEQNVAVTPKSSFQALREKWEKLASSPSTPTTSKPSVPSRRLGYSPSIESKIKVFQNFHETSGSKLIDSPLERRQSLGKIQRSINNMTAVSDTNEEYDMQHENQDLPQDAQQTTIHPSIQTSIQDSLQDSRQKSTQAVEENETTTHKTLEAQEYDNKAYHETKPQMEPKTNTDNRQSLPTVSQAQMDDKYDQVLSRNNSTTDVDDAIEETAEEADDISTDVDDAEYDVSDDGEMADEEFYDDITSQDVSFNEDISVYKELNDPHLLEENERMKKYRESLSDTAIVKNIQFEELNLCEPRQDVLCPRFSVFKLNSKKQMFSKKTRLWEVDMISGELRNMDQKRVLKKKHHADNVLILEKRIKNQLKIRLTLSGSNRQYELVFKDSKERERFYQCLMILKKNSVVWSPNFFSEDVSGNFAIVKLNSSFQHEPYKFGAQSINTDSEGAVCICTSKVKDDPIQIFTGTWNMANSPPPSANIMTDWITPGMDIYAIALQESDTRMDAFSYVQLFKQILGPDYFSVGNSTLWAIRLFVFAKDVHLGKITSVEIKQKPTGFMQICGNKGGIGLSMKFNETSICFVSSHLAAKEENFDRRNADIYGISGRLTLGVKALDITQFDHVFWCGDLNYRLDLPYSEAVSLAQDCNFEELQESDQLRKLINQGLIFNEWNEGDIRFKPTYKYKQGTGEYAQAKYRPPSYCDRILWTSQPGCNATQIEYSAATKILTSDHMPVRATFKVDTQLPFVDYFTPPSSSKKIIFSGLYLSGRSGSLIRKPQLSFYSCVLQQNPQRSVAKDVKAKLVNPAFPDETIPVLIPLTTNTEYLKTQRIIIAIREISKKKSKNDDDEFIGQCSISLENAFEGPFKFKAPVSVNTKRVGQLIGYVQVIENN